MGETVHRVARRRPRRGPRPRRALRTRSTSPRRAASSCGARRDRHLERDRSRQRRGHAHAAGKPPVLVLRPVGGAPDPGPRRRAPRARRGRPSRPRPPRAGPRCRPRRRARGSRRRPPAAGRPRRARRRAQRDGLQRAHLTVRVLEGGQRDAGARRARSTNSLGVDPTVAVDADGHPVPGEVRGVQHRRALDGADDDVRPRPATPAGDGPDRTVQRSRVRRAPGRPPAVRAPTAAAIASRAPSSSILARRPSACRRRGSAQPWSSASRNAVRASGEQRRTPAGVQDDPTEQWRRHRRRRRAVGGVVVARAAHGGTVTPQSRHQARRPPGSARRDGRVR